MRHIKTSIIFFFVYMAGLLIYALQNVHKRDGHQRAAKALVKNRGNSKGTIRIEKNERTRTILSDSISPYTQSTFWVSM